MKNDIAIEQRIKLRNESIYGVWADQSMMMEFKISPMGPYTRVKIMDIKNKVALNIISTYCGLKFCPKRTNWKGFDFITHLEQTDANSFRDGLVHMPNATRKNFAHLTIVDKAKIFLEFNFFELRNEEKVLNQIGSFTLIKKSDTDRSTLFG